MFLSLHLRLWLDSVGSENQSWIIILFIYFILLVQCYTVLFYFDIVGIRAQSSRVAEKRAGVAENAVWRYWTVGFQNILFPSLFWLMENIKLYYLQGQNTPGEKLQQPAVATDHSGLCTGFMTICSNMLQWHIAATNHFVYRRIFVIIFVSATSCKKT